MDAKLIQYLIDEASGEFACDLRDEVDTAIANQLVTSPIEKVMAFALEVMDGFSPHEVALSSEFNTSYGRRVQIVPQFPIGPYTADFAILVEGEHRHFKYVVECDGHAFHEKTKEQAAHDKKRDRFMQRLGWKVMRFTGREICSDPRTCAQEVGDQIWEELCPRVRAI